MPNISFFLFIIFITYVVMHDYSGVVMHDYSGVVMHDYSFVLADWLVVQPETSASDCSTIGNKKRSLKWNGPMSQGRS